MTDVLRNPASTDNLVLATQPSLAPEAPDPGFISIDLTPCPETDTRPGRLSAFIEKITSALRREDDGFVQYAHSPEETRKREAQARHNARQERQELKASRAAERAAVKEMRQRNKQIMGAPIVKAWVNIKNASREFIEAHTSKRTARVTAGIGASALAGIGLYMTFKYASQLAEGSDSIANHSPKGQLPFTPKLPSPLLEHTPKPSGLNQGLHEHLRPSNPNTDHLDPLFRPSPNTSKVVAEIAPSKVEIPEGIFDHNALPSTNANSLKVSNPVDALNKAAAAYAKASGQHVEVRPNEGYQIYVNYRPINPMELPFYNEEYKKLVEDGVIELAA